MQNTDNTPEQKEEIPRTTSGFLIFLFKKIIEKRKYWLLLVWCLLAALGLILFLTGNGALLPAIYMAF
jgi:hypothetical protein